MIFRQEFRQLNVGILTYLFVAYFSSVILTTRFTSKICMHLWYFFLTRRRQNYDLVVSFIAITSVDDPLYIIVTFVDEVLLWQCSSG